MAAGYTEETHQGRKGTREKEQCPPDQGAKGTEKEWEQGMAWSFTRAAFGGCA